MFVGVQRVVLQIPGARSLKDRRQVVRSFKERLQSRLRISVAEVGDLDNPRVATIAMAVVANEAAFCDEVLARAASMASTLPDAVLADRATEVIPFGHGASGLQGGIEHTELDADGSGFPYSDDEDDDGTR